MESKIAKYPAETRPESPRDRIDPHRPRSNDEPEMWIMRVRFLFYRLIAPFVERAVRYGIWEDQQKG